MVSPTENMRQPSSLNIGHQTVIFISERKQLATKLSSLLSLPFGYIEDTDLYPHKWSAEILYYCATEPSLIEHWSLLFKKSTRTLAKLPFTVDGKTQLKIYRKSYTYYLSSQR